MICQLLLCFLSVFFFKQKTAYEMRISDWSSDVCSSDLCSPVSSPPSFAKPFSQWAGALRRSARREPIRAVPSEPFASTSVPTRRRCSPRMASIRPARSRRSQPNWREEGDMTHDPARLAAMLLADGYCIVKDAIAPDAIAAIEADLALRFEATPFCEGGFYGARTKRFGALLRRSRHAAALVRHPLILTIAETILGQWCDRIALNLTQAVEIHPGAFAQAPHRDQDLWGGDKTGMEYQLNVIWPVDPFTADNGATRLWPGSHRDDAVDPFAIAPIAAEMRSEEHTSELQSLMRTSYAVFCLKKKNTTNTNNQHQYHTQR